jgi:hypothetical protein
LFEGIGLGFLCLGDEVGFGLVLEPVQREALLPFRRVDAVKDRTRFGLLLNIFKRKGRRDGLCVDRGLGRGGANNQGRNETA